MLRNSPLHENHLELQARMVDFGGWEMPVSYPSGTLLEHRTCREDAVVFDVSHLGTVRVEGSSAFEALQKAFTNDLGKIEPGRAQYTHLCNENGGVVDDIIVWWRDDDTFDIMPNASNTSEVIEAIGGTDITAMRAVLAIQGPSARTKFEKISSAAANIPRFGVSEFSFDGETCVVAGTGYTGEDGIECAVPLSVANSLWNAILDCDVLPAGLGARDTLRLEAGLPLHGHELGPDISPLEAGLSWVVAFDKPNFRGRDSLMTEREHGVERKLVGLVSTGKQPFRAECDVVLDGQPIGQTTSGNYSPVLDRGIAMAFLNPRIEIGTEVEVILRGKAHEAQVCKLPFYKVNG